MLKELFTLNPDLDRPQLAETFERDGRIQIRNFLTEQTAEEVYGILSTATPWGIAWQAGTNGPNAIEAPQLRQAPVDRQREIDLATYRSAASGEYAFQFARYPILNAYLEKWNEGGPHDLLLEYINAEDFLTFIREVTGIPQIVKGDAQATLFAPGQFLGQHTDSHLEEGWLVAYVMNFCKNWKPDWGGYLNFLDEDGDIIRGFRPRFNSLNMFKVPRPHHVSYVPPFAPVERFAITGWFRDH